jgi:hypothetical protein
MVVQVGTHVVYFPVETRPGIFFRCVCRQFASAYSAQTRYFLSLHLHMYDIKKTPPFS